ncbi:MAG: cupin domain-containing protein [Pseudomonadota bacterium]
MTPKKATDVEPRGKKSNYPEPFASMMAGRVKRQLGDAFGLKNFGVNLTTLEPGAVSALLHVHSVQDEFVYILDGTATLVLESGEHELGPGDCMGFPANGEGHQLANRSNAPVTYLEIGDRLPGDSGSYPKDDLVATMTDKGWAFTHKDGTPYE